MQINGGFYYYLIPHILIGYYSQHAIVVYPKVFKEHSNKLSGRALLSLTNYQLYRRKSLAGAVSIIM